MVELTGGCVSRRPAEWLVRCIWEIS